MKNVMSSMVMVVSVLVMGASANASVAQLAGTWNGTGTSFAMDGSEQGQYQLQMVNVLESDGAIDSTMTIVIPGGTPKHFKQTIRDTQNGFTMVSDQGSGGALRLGDGLCEGYFGDSNGNGVAMTTIMDSNDRFRVVKTMLHGYKAVSISRETYVRALSK